MIELALVGKGKWGQNHIKTIKNISEAHLNPKNIKTQDYPDLFERNDIDGVIIATPTNTHYEIARAFITNSLNILIEKPITRTHEEALKLQGLSEEQKVVVLCGHILLFDPGYVKLKESLPLIGAIKRMIFKGLQSPAREDCTALEDWGPHPIYLFIDLIGRSPKKVSSKPVNNDNFHLEFNFGEKLVGIADIGFTSPKKERQLSVIGNKGSLTLDWSGPEKELSFEDKNEGKKDISFDATKSPLELELGEFVECIKGGKKTRAPLSQGVEVMRILDLFRLS